MNFGTDCLYSCNSMKFLMPNFSIPLELHNPVVNLSLVPKLSSELALCGQCTHQGPAHRCSAGEEGTSLQSSSPVLHTGLLHYATQEGWTEAQVNVPDVPVPAENLQGERVVRDSQSEMSVELCCS